ncbi:MAG: HAD-IB family phosphatase [Methyloceanibacter sp.]
MTPQRRNFDIVCFDCDSTLSCIEGIDELARRAGVEDEVVPLTAAAMAGTLSLDAIYEKRLSLVRPDQAAVEWLGRRYVEEIVPGARETIAALTRAGTAVHIVSGGLSPAVVPLAHVLEVPSSHVHAVDVIFEDDGSYRDFDRGSPLIHSNGKAIVCPSLAASRIALVGDGVTDLAARKSGVFVVGFGGVTRREALVTGADVFVARPNLTAVLDTLLGSAEC